MRKVIIEEVQEVSYKDIMKMIAKVKMQTEKRTIPLPILNAKKGDYLWCAGKGILKKTKTVKR